MKVFIAADGLYVGLQSALEDELASLNATGDQILVSDSGGDSDLVQQLLIQGGCENVTVYSCGQPLKNEGSWPVEDCLLPDLKSRVGEVQTCGDRSQVLTSLAMAMDADCGLLFWAALSDEMLLTILILVGLGKPVKAFTPNLGAPIASLDDVLEMLPAENPLHISDQESLPAEERERIVDEFLPLRTMSSYLKGRSLSKRDLVELILGAPISLKRKLAACQRCACYDDIPHEAVRSVKEWLVGNGALPLERKASAILRLWQRVRNASFYTHYIAIACALKALESSPKKRFSLTCCWNVWPESGEPYRTSIGPFSTLKDALGDGRAEMLEEKDWDEEEDWPDDPRGWSEVDVSWPDDSGRHSQTYAFWFIDDQPIFFDELYRDEWQNRWRPLWRLWPDEPCYGGDDMGWLDLPTPFRTGDLLELDCRPFSFPAHCLVLEADDGMNDGHMPTTVLIRQRGESPELGDGNWTSWMLKDAGSAMRICSPGYSPLYRAEYCQEDLLEQDEKVLAEVRHWLDGNLEKAARLDDALLETGHGMSTPELVCYMNQETER